MRRTLLIAVVAFLMLWLSGCMVIDCEDYGPPAGVCVVPVHPHPVVEVIHVPRPGPCPSPYPHPHSHHRHR